jgi:Protein of unknown function (DUF4079)
MEVTDFLGLVHPVFAVLIVFPIIGVVLNYAWATRQRRLQTVNSGKSKIPPMVGADHRRLGNWLTSTVVGLTLIGLAHPISKNIIKKQLWLTKPFEVLFIILLFAATVFSLIFLYRAGSKMWRGIFATLTGAGLIILGSQDGVYRRDFEWYLSHYYIGMAAAMLMIFSLAIVPEIYKDKSNRWRIIHTILNSVAVLLFIGQGMTGARDLLEIPLSWQEPYIYKCDFVNKTCITPQQLK